MSDRVSPIAVGGRSEAAPLISPRLGNIDIVGLAAQRLWSGLAAQLAVWDGAG